MKYSMRFPDEVLEMDFIGYGEKDKYRTYLAKEVEKVFGLNGLDAFRMVTGRVFSAKDPSQIKQWCEENFGELVVVSEEEKMAG